MRTIVVVPTIREANIVAFLDAWADELGDAEVFVVEDNPEPTFSVARERVRHFTWRDVDADLADHAWIVPRRTDCVRCYGFWRAWWEGPDAIVTLDDDCFPSEPGFLDAHTAALAGAGAEEAWVSTVRGLPPRGIPYRETARRRPVLMNHGLWHTVPDYDAVTQLIAPRLEERSRCEPIQQTIPAGKYFPLSGMNVAFRPEAVPALYFLLMGKDQPYDRFGDIWAGLFLKRIADHLGYAVTSGSPVIQHKRASDVWANLRKESPGLPVNEVLWDAIDRAVLTSRTVAGCYRELADALEASDAYWHRLKEAMRIWASLFARP